MCFFSTSPRSQTKKASLSSCRQVKQRHSFSTSPPTQKHCTKPFNAWAVYRQGRLLDLLLNDIFGRKALLQEREFQLRVHGHTKSFRSLIRRRRAHIDCSSSQFHRTFKKNPRQPGWEPTQTTQETQFLNAGRHSHTNTITEAHTRKGRVVPQEAHGGSRVKLKPFK